jgi:hypothetical protein
MAGALCSPYWLATLATAATLPAKKPRTVANVATVARPDDHSETSEDRSVANVASVAEAFAGTALGETAEADGTAACLAGFAGLAPFVELYPGFRPQAWAAIRAREVAFC